MITEKALMQEIEECQSHTLTDKKVQRLADCYIILDHLFGKSFDDAPKINYNIGYSGENRVENTIKINGDTDFLKAINNKNAEKVMLILDELMEANKILHPKMYNRVIDKINDL